jgi:hypothetical protein
MQKNSHSGSLFSYIFIGMLVMLSTFEYDFSILVGVLSSWLSSSSSSSSSS